MNRLFAIILMSVSLVFTISFPVKADVIDDMCLLIKAGNITELSKNIASSVELKIVSEEGTYPKAQAEAVLKDFFKKHQPASAKVIHKITSNPSLLFGVVILNTNSGNFRTSFSMKNISGKYFITEISFEINKD